MNLINTQGPTGSVRYEADPSAPGGYRQVTDLSPEQQQAYQQGMGVYNQALGVAGDQVGRVGASLGQGFSMDGLPELQGGLTEDFSGDRQRVEEALYRRATGMLDPQFAKAREGMDATLTARGLGMNSAAAQNMGSLFNQNERAAYGEARDSAIIGGGAEQSRLLADALANRGFGNQARTQGMQERAYQQNLPLEQLQALLGTGQVSMPQGVAYTPSAVGQTDVLGAYGLSQQAQQANYAQRMGTYNNILGGLFNLGSSAIRGGGGGG